MTAATSGSKTGIFSMAWFGNIMVTWTYIAYVFIKLMAGLAGAAALAVADTYIGGIVLVEMFSTNADTTGKTVGWALSIGTSAALLALWGFAFAKKKLGWMLIIPALVISGVDVLVDGRFPTLQMYGLDVVMHSGVLPPQANFAWWLLETLIIGVTVFNEGIIMMIFMWLFMEVKRLTEKPMAANI